MLAASTISHTVAQSVIKYETVTAACVDLNQTALTQVASGKLNEAELAVSAALSSGDDHAQDSCAGLVLNNMAAFMGALGRISDAERLAERSVLVLEKALSPNDEKLLRPLQTLIAAQLQEGKTPRAREAFRRMQSIRIQKPEDRALFHWTAAVLLGLEGRRAQAEAEFLATIDTWEEAGRGNSADAGGVLTNLASLYVIEGRLDDARPTLDRAVTILSRAKDSIPMDRIRLLGVRGALFARQNNWRQAEQDLHDALSMSDQESWVDPVLLRSILTNYAVVLRKNHHRREARSIEARAAAIQIDRTRAGIVDITDLLPKTKPTRK
jgi:tetratricopeptide (TPR) repeat protein